jgi:DnaA family protein
MGQQSLADKVKTKKTSRLNMSETSEGVQLFLPVQIRLEKRFEHFLGEANSKALDALKHFIERRNETLLFLVGPESGGKTHLLSAAVSYFEALYQDQFPDLSAGYFSLAEIAGESWTAACADVSTLAELTVFFESFDFLALDDLDYWLQCASSQSENAKRSADMFLFALFNHFKEHNKQLVIASRTVPSRLHVELKDLVSRLASGLLVTVTKLNDQEKDQLIRTLARLRGFLLDDDVSAFILKRSGRDLSDLLTVLDKLDQASLIEKRKLTVPFVKKILNW